MEPHTIAIVVAVVLAAAWLLTDRVVYKGSASVIANNMKHYSTTHKTVMVVPHASTKLGRDILVASVTNAQAAKIAAAGIAAHQITVRRRLFGQPRVTRIA